MKTRILALTFLLLAVGALQCGAEEVTYSGRIKALVEANCSGCHGKDAAPEYQLFKKEKEKWLAKGQGMRMDTYSHLVFYTAWPDTGALMRRLDDGGSSKDGKPGNMYQHLGSTAAERQQNLTLFKRWVGNWSLKRWNEIDKDELNGITVKY